MTGQGVTESLAHSGKQDPHLPMSCRAIMTVDPVTLRTDDHVELAAERLMAQRFIILPVVDAEGRYEGLFGVFELLRLLLPRGATVNHLLPDLRFMTDDLGALQSHFGEMAGEPIGRHLRTDLPVLGPETPVIEALLQFYRNRTTLPVVEPTSRKLLGVLSYWDALAAIARSDQHPGI